ncbi:MAG TPA: hypothetical protein VFA98_06295 [Thermoanaerobaculia bacterium]|nr:hypothetical protein [Thermoanaerobaculia bacterium]
MEIFPPDLPIAKPNSSDYTWRGQIAWVWAKAGWLDQKLRGQGTQKHWVYRLKPQGRLPIEKIAEDQVAASFYVSIKRPTTAGADYPADWYQAPPTRGLDAEPAKTLKQKIEESDEPWDGEPSRTEPSSQDATATTQVEGGGSLEGLVASFLEQNFRALETVIGTLGEIKKEVKAQSDLVLEAAQKLEGSASKEDVAQAAAEIASVLARKPQVDPGPGIHTMLTQVQQVQQKFATELATIAERRKVDDDSLVDRISKSVAESLKKSLEKDISKATSAAVASSEAVDMIAANARTQLGKFRDEALAAIADKKKGRSETLGGKLEVLEARASEIEDRINELAEGTDAIDASLISLAVEMKKSTAAVAEAHTRALDTASELVAAARTIVKEMLDLGMERAAAGGQSFNVIRTKAIGAIERLNETEERVNQRSAPTGASLVMAPTSISSLGGGFVPIGKADASDKDEDEDEDEDES